MTTTDLTAMDLALKDLTLHELNARAASPETYEAGDIAVLAASIAALGLLNPLIVQKAGKMWGVLAGGRRLAALRHLANDKAAKGWSPSTKIACRVIGDDVAAATAITLAENVTQKPMDPLDEFEAFARMMEVGGQDADAIARTFGVERRRVVERLRYGRVHPEIRAAAREKKIGIEAMKAFADHPDQAVQLDTYRATQGEYLEAWKIRNALRRRGVKMGDEIAKLVIDGYRAAGGPIAADLIEEDSILSDEALVERLLMEALTAHAATEAVRLGFAWSLAMRQADYKVLGAYGRVYPTATEPAGEDAKRAEAIAARLAQIEEAREAAFDGEGDLDEEALDALDEEHERLTAEYDDLTTGWRPEDLARAGVLAHWQDGRIAIVHGLIRPEDRTDSRTSPAGTVSGHAGSPGGADEDGALVLAESLQADLKTERAMVVGSALAAAPDLAHDLLLFKTVADLLGRGGSVAHSLAVTARVAERPHGKRDGVDGRAAESLAALHAGLDLTWWNDGHSMPERLKAFRALAGEMKSRILAVALADAVEPSDYGYREELMAHVARQLVPEMRALWRPTGEAFFGRLKKSVLLRLIAHDLHQPEEAARLASEKKTAIVAFLDRLFAAPFATLTAEQREAVETWCPPGMEIAPPQARHEYPGEGRLRGGEPEAAPEGEADEEPFGEEPPAEEPFEEEPEEAEAERETESA